MRFGLAVLILTALWVQEAAPQGGIRAILLERDQTPAGTLTVRLENDRVYCFRFDAKTYIEEDHRRIEAGKLQPGDQLEITGKRGTTPLEPYARVVKVVGEIPMAGAPAPAEATTALGDGIFPRGNLLFVGAVTARNKDCVVLRTTRQGLVRFALREDTRYVRDGERASASDLAVNNRVSVRAGRNLTGELEAYQVVWGEILKP